MQQILRVGLYVTWWMTWLYLVERVLPFTETSAGKTALLWWTVSMAVLVPVLIYLLLPASGRQMVGELITAFLLMLIFPLLIQVGLKRLFGFYLLVVWVFPAALVGFSIGYLGNHLLGRGGH